MASFLDLGAGARLFRSWVARQSGWRREGLSFFCGSLSVLAFAPFFASPVLFLTFPVFIWLVSSSASEGAAAKTAWWFGFGYFFFNLVWIGEAFLVEAEKFAWLLPFAVTLLPAGLALFWAAAGWALKRLHVAGLAAVVAFAVLISAVEWLRGNILTGLPWDVPGYALMAPDVLMQSAGLVGIYGLTFVACVVFAVPLVLMSAGEGGESWSPLAALMMALVPLTVLAVYGYVRMQTPIGMVDGVKLRIVQPSVPQREKWLPEFQKQIFYDHLALSRSNAAGDGDDLSGITHVVWPEAAMPFFPLETPKALEEIAAMLPEGRLLLTGAIRHGPALDAVGGVSASVYNGILVFDDQAKVVGHYDKIHLVPFGEYLPMESLLESLGLKKLTYGRGAFSTGVAPKPMLVVPGLPPVAAVVCYEALFPREVVQTRERPGLILNVTNDGWFGNSTGPRQHFHQARVRAVEQGVPLVRAANNGISGIVDPLGRVSAELGMNVRGVVDGPLPQAIDAPLYARFGDWIFLLIETLGAIFLIWRLRRAGR